jgi:protein TonB
MLRVFVTAEGLPSRVNVETSSGSAALDAAAVDEVKKSWRFVPARQVGQAVDAWVLVPVVFKLDNGS